MTSTNTQAANILERHIASGRIFNAYRFVGPGGVGKFETALWFSNKLDSDRLIYEPEEGSVEEFRKFILLSKLKSAKTQVYIIKKAETLTPPNFSALLKTLEEATGGNIFILLDSRDHLPPTIVSRCQTIRFSASYIKPSLDTETRVLFAETGPAKTDLLLWAMKTSEMESSALADKLAAWLVSAKQKFAEDPPAWSRRLTLLDKASKDLPGNINKKIILEQIATKW